MKMIKAIVRPERVADVLSSLAKEGIKAATRMSILGRGKQQGLKVAEVHYDEIPKEMIMVVVENRDEDKAIKVIIDNSRTGKKGAFGDGKIFVTEVQRTVTISTGKEEL